MMRVQDSFDPDLRRRISAGPHTAIISLGATEQHGAHLPVSTDSDIAGEVARRLAQKMRLLLLPEIRYGVSFEHAPLFNLSIRSATLQSIINDIASSLASNGINMLFVINGHHGNQKALERLEERSGCAIHAISYWKYMSGAFDHAGLAESSLMLAISKNTKMSKAKKGFIEPPMSAKEHRELARRASVSFTSVAKNGIWGDPRGASAERGHRMLAEIIRNITREFKVYIKDARAGRTRKAAKKSMMGV